MEDNTKNTLDISWEAIVKIVFTVFLVYLLYQISEILIWIIFAFIIAILFSPLVEYLRKIKIPRPLAVVIVYLGIFGTLSSLVYILAPGLYSEVRNFANYLPNYIESVSPYLHYFGVESFTTIEELMEVFYDSFEKIMASAFNVLAVIFGGFFSAVFVIILAFFISLEGNVVERGIEVMASKRRQEYMLAIWEKCRNQVSKWFLIRILTGLFVGISSYIAFYFLGVEYALLFAIIGGLLNIIPYIGPVVAGIIFFIILALTNFIQAFFVVVAFTIIQTIESAITPYLSQKIMGVSSVLVLIAITIGGYLWGVLGAILAIPLLGIIFEFTKAYLEKRKK